jgi:hypothetical protein
MQPTINFTKFSRENSRINVRLKTNVLETSYASIIMVEVNEGVS